MPRRPSSATGIIVAFLKEVGQEHCQIMLEEVQVLHEKGKHTQLGKKELIGTKIHPGCCTP